MHLPSYDEYLSSHVNSNANIGEVVANAELGCQHITILATHLKEMTETPLDETSLKKYPFLRNPPPKRKSPYYKNLKTAERLKGHATIDPLAREDWDGTLPPIDRDYLANDGALLVECMANDPAVVRKIKDVFTAFTTADARAKIAIEAEISKLD